MLENVFLKVLQMSFTASIVILAVFLIRLLLQNAPKIFSYVLWIAVLFRLLCPVSFSSVCSVFSIFQRTDSTVMEYNKSDQWNLSDYSFTDFSKTATLNKTSPLSKSDTFVHTKSFADGNTPAHIVKFLSIYGVWIWLAGIFILAGSNAIALLWLRRNLKNATAKEKQVYISDQIDTPFVLGIRTPRIYLPAFLENYEYDYILFHEQIHIQRKDYLCRSD